IKNRQCTNSQTDAMKTLNIVLPDAAYTAISKLARKKGVDAPQYCSALLSEHAQDVTPKPSLKEKPGNGSHIRQITEVDLMREILAYLRKVGGSAQKVAVEQGLYEGFNDIFKQSYYQELVGGGVPRWQKNIQFARNTARNMGLIKSPEESGRGNW